MMTTKRRDLVKQYTPPDADIQKEVDDAFGAADQASLVERYDSSVQDFDVNKIVKGRILDIVGDDVVVDVGYKSEGIIPTAQWGDLSAIDIGDTVDVLIEAVEDESGMIVLSKRKADRIRGWETVISTYDRGDTVSGVVTRKIKGGLLVDIGVQVFLPASQISIRRVPEIGDFIGRQIRCKIIKIDESRMNIVVSRRRLIEDRREKQKKDLLEQLRENDIVTGVVKNIADFGAFVDLGGLDGLLHITDMSWGRVQHPSEMLAIDDEIEIKVIKIDAEKERISLGLKQKVTSPWEDVELKYPVHSVVRGRVVNVLSYGAFIKLETGVEGLVHISEMSWTRRINHPSEVVKAGDMIDVMILDYNPSKQEISLGIKQTQANPWDLVEERYPPGTVLQGRIRNLTNYGAFVEIEEGIDGLLHVSDISWTKNIRHPMEVLKKGDVVECMVLSVDKEKKRVALGIKQLHEDPWDNLIPTKYERGSLVSGKVTKITNFGVFVEIEEGLEGLLHVSELSTRKVENPADVVSVGEELQVKVIKVDVRERRIGLSRRAVEDETYLPPEDYEIPEIPETEAPDIPEDDEGE